MNGWHRIGLLALGIVGVNAATCLVLIINQRNNVYPPDADTIIIPMFETALISLIAVPALVTTAFLPVSAWLKIKKTAHSPWRYTLNAIAALSYLFLALVALGGMYSWARPDHYLVAGSYLVLLAVLVVLLLEDMKGVRSNIRMERARER